MTIDQVCNQCENLSNEAFNQLVNQKLNAVMPKLNNITLNIGNQKFTGDTLLTHILIATVITDYTVTDSEVRFLTTMITTYINPGLDFPTVKQFIMNMGNNVGGTQAFADSLIDALGRIENQLKVDIVMLCMLLASVDGKITASERNFLAKLLA